jgi:hypothetical protein
MSAPIVFFDIAGPDAATLKSFYAGNFGWEIDATNGITAPGLKGSIRQDPPETLIYLGVPDINAALKQIEASGGQTVLPRMGWCLVSSPWRCSRTPRATAWAWSRLLPELTGYRTGLRPAPFSANMQIN